MKHMDLADYMRENYSIVVDKKSDKFTKFLAKYTSYCVLDKVVSTPEEVQTEGYFYVGNDTKLLVEDIMYNLVKLQMEKKVILMIHLIDIIIIKYKNMWYQKKLLLLII